MKTKLTGSGLTFAAVVLASVALAGGCCSRRSTQAAYYSEAPKGYAETTTTQETQTSAQAQPMEGNNQVIPLYKESLNVGTRQVDAGSVRVRKIVKTETVNQPVELRHEEIVIERQAGTGQPIQGDMSQAFQGGDTMIRLTKDEPVIEKQTTSAGQIVLNKKSESEQRNIQEQVRSEDVDVVKFGNPQNVTIGQGVQSSDMGGAESSGGQTSGSSWGTITDPSMCNASSAGRSVQFSNLKVNNVVGDRLAVLSSNSGQTLYAVCPQAASVKPGDTVSLTGTIRAGGSASGLSGDAAQTLSSQSMYIDAQKLEAAGQ